MALREERNAKWYIQPGHDLVKGKGVAFDGTEWVVSDAPQGVVIMITADAVKVASDGVCENCFTGLTPGDFYNFDSSGDPDANSTGVLLALSATTVLFNNAGESSGGGGGSGDVTDESVDVQPFDMAFYLDDTGKKISNSKGLIGSDGWLNFRVGTPINNPLGTPYALIIEEVNTDTLFSQFAIASVGIMFYNPNTMETEIFYDAPGKILTVGQVQLSDGGLILGDSFNFESNGNILCARVEITDGGLSIDGQDGVSGTFTTADLKTVTVNNGIIVDIL